VQDNTATNIFPVKIGSKITTADLFKTFNVGGAKEEGSNLEESSS